MPSASQSARDTAVEHAYDAWKSTYLVHGCASNEYYVSTKGDGDATNNGPVSEGQGYGMNIVPLMAGYDANAQTEFNGLWQLVKDHEDQYGLMQWQLDGKTCKYYSSGTPDGATDGDLDIGYGLILADAQWGGYTADAKAWLAAFYAHDVASDGHLKCEDDGPSTDTRPSDDMLDHLRAFAAYDTAHDWAKVVTRMQAITTEFTSAYSPSADLMSDFVVNANTTSPKPAPANYQEDQPDNIVGYNSIRVPWHMGTDALEYGSSVAAVSYGVAQKESACLKGLAGRQSGEGPAAHQAELRQRQRIRRYAGRRGRRPGRTGGDGRRRPGVDRRDLGPARDQPVRRRVLRRDHQDARLHRDGRRLVEPRDGDCPGQRLLDLGEPGVRLGDPGRLGEHHHLHGGDVG